MAFLPLYTFSFCMLSMFGTVTLHKSNTSPYVFTILLRIRFNKPSSSSPNYLEGSKKKQCKPRLKYHVPCHIHTITLRLQVCQDSSIGHGACGCSGFKPAQSGSSSGGGTGSKPGSGSGVRLKLLLPQLLHDQPGTGATAYCKD